MDAAWFKPSEDPPRSAVLAKSRTGTGSEERLLLSVVFTIIIIGRPVAPAIVDNPGRRWPSRQSVPTPVAACVFGRFVCRSDLLNGQRYLGRNWQRRCAGSLECSRRGAWCQAQRRTRRGPVDRYRRVGGFSRGLREEDQTTNCTDRNRNQTRNHDAQHDAPPAGVSFRSLAADRRRSVPAGTPTRVNERKTPPHRDAQTKPHGWSRRREARLNAKAQVVVPGLPTIRIAGESRVRLDDDRSHGSSEHCARPHHPQRRWLRWQECGQCAFQNSCRG